MSSNNSSPLSARLTCTRSSRKSKFASKEFCDSENLVHDLFLGCSSSSSSSDESHLFEAQAFEESCPSSVGLSSVVPSEPVPPVLPFSYAPFCPTKRFKTGSSSYSPPFSVPFNAKQLDARVYVATLPSVEIPVFDDEFLHDGCLFHVHSTSTSVVKLSCSEVSRSPPVLDFDSASFDSYFMSVSEVDYLLSTVDALPNRDDIIVAVSPCCAVSRRPSACPLPLTDFVVVEALSHYKDKSTDCIVSRPASVPDVIVPFYSREWIEMNFPTVVGFSNLCVECSEVPSWVDICPHVFSSLYSETSSEVNFQNLYAFLYPRLWNYLHFSGQPPPFSLDCPYTRLVFAYTMRTFVVPNGPSYDVCDRWLSAETHRLSLSYDYHFEAQAIDDFLGRATDLFTRISDYLCDAPNSALFLITEFVNGFRDFVVQTLVNFGAAVLFASVSRFVSSFLDKVRNLKNAVVDFCLKHTLLIELFCKVVIRHLCDYSLDNQLLELALVGLTTNNVLGFFSSPLYQAQADSDPLISLLSILFGALTTALSCAAPTKNVARILTGGMLSIAAFDRADMWRKLLALYDYLSGNPDAGTIESYRTGNTKSAIDFYHCFVNLYSQHSDLTVEQKYLLGALYDKYLTDAVSYTKEEASYISNLLRPAIAFVNAQSICRVQQYRRVPDVFAFHGDPGLGKSTLIDHILQQVANISTGKPDIDSLVYTANCHDQYSSGYCQQPIWRFDEMFAEKDGDTFSTQSPFVSYLFKLCTPSPQALNMASLDDKGKFLRCSLVIGACNLKLEVPGAIPGIVKSVHSLSAVNDRVNYRIQPMLRDGFTIKNRSIYKLGVLQTNVHPSDLYHFKITNCRAVLYTREELGLLPSNEKWFSYHELLSVICSSFIACQEFVPLPFKSDITDPVNIISRLNLLSGGRITKPTLHVVDDGKEEIPPDPIVDNYDVDYLGSSSSGSSSSSSSSSSNYEGQGWFSWLVPSQPACDSDKFKDADGKVIEDFLYEIRPFDPSVDSLKTVSAFSTLAYRLVPVPSYLNDTTTLSRQYSHVRCLSHITPAIICASAFSIVMVALGIRRAVTNYHRPPETHCNLDTIDVPVEFSAQSLPQRNKKYVNHSYEAHAETSPWLGVGNLRGHSMFLRISSQLFSLRGFSGTHICDVLALNDTTLMGPGHILNDLAAFSLVGVLHNQLPFHRNFDNNEFSVKSDVVGTDCALISLKTPLPCVRSINTLVNRSSSCIGSVVRLFRDGMGKLHVSMLTSSEFSGRIQYKHREETITLAFGDFREGEGSSFAGLCGAVYLNLTQSESEVGRGGPLFGMHVAGRTSQNRWVASMIRRQLVDCVVPNNLQPALSENGSGPFAKAGIVTQKCSRKVPLINKPRLGRVISMPYTGPYAPALLYPALASGGLVTPINKYLDTLRRPVSGEDLPDLTDTCLALLKRLMPMLPTIDPSERSFLSIIGGTDFTGSIDRSASPGIPFSYEGHTKGHFCLTDTDVEILGLEKQIAPSNSLLDILAQHELNLMQGYESPVVGAVALKEEPRLKDKVLAGSTRVYTVCPLHENIILKKWFIRSLRLISFGWRHHSGMSDLDAEGKHIHDAIIEKLREESLIRFGDDPFEFHVIACDMVNFDLSFTPALMKYISFVLRCLEQGKILPDEFINAHNGTNQDKMRFILLLRCIDFLVQSGFEMFFSKGHPSGGALTCLINFIGAFIAFTFGFEVLPDVLWYPLFMGDDTFIITSSRVSHPYNLQQFTIRVKQCGFNVTNDAKTGDPEKLPLFDPSTERISRYSFCSRHFTKTQCVLAPDRLSRILPFQRVGSERENIASCLDAVRRYSIPYNIDGLLDFIPDVVDQVKFCGFSDFQEFLKLDAGTIQHRFFENFTQNPKVFLATIPDYNVKKPKPTEIVFDGEDEEWEAQGDSDGGSDSAFADSVTDVITTHGSPPIPYLSQHMPSHEFAVADRFNRPLLIDSFDTGATFALQSYSALSSYFSALYPKLGIFNHAFLHCTVCMRCVVSSSPFVYGRIFLGCSPGTYLPTTIYEAYGYKGVELDLSTANQAELRFPMITPSNWAVIDAFTLSNPYNYLFDYGKFFILPMTTLSASVRLTTYIWLEDVKLRGSCISVWAIAEGNDDDPKGKSKVASKSKKVVGHEDWLREHTPGWVATGEATVNSLGNMIEKVESSVLGPIGSFAEKAGASISTASSAIPALIGLSAPPMDTHVTGTVILNNTQNSHMIGEVATVKLAASQCTRIISPPDMFNSNVDEMDIHEVVRDFAVFAICPWAGTDVSGSSLCHFVVNPGIYTSSTPAVYPHQADVCRLAYVSSLFRLWRGMLRYRFSIPKTSFQTGVLEIVYQSGRGGISSDISLNVALSRTLWDITKSSTLEIDVPYNSITAWSPVIFQPIETNDGFNTTSTNTGGITINIINALVDASGLVPGPVEIIMYVAAGGDFELARPGFPGSAQIYPEPAPYTPSLLRSPPPSTSSLYEAQGGDLFQENEVNAGRIIVAATPSTEWGHLTTVGERILNLRLLTRRMSAFNVIIFNELTPSLGYSNFFSTNRMLAAVSMLYAFRTGGYRLSFDYYNIGNAAIIALQFGPLPSPGDPHLVRHDRTTETGVCHCVDVPYTNITPFLPIRNTSTYYPDNVRVYFTRYEADHAFAGRVSMSAADDYNLGYLVGAPPIQVVSSVTPAYF
nr:MAG: polyprotein [Picornavirales sp.]